jgi:excisionase family DNA binding protein
VRVVEVDSAESRIGRLVYDQPEIPLPALIDVDTLAHHLGVTVHHVRRLVQERRIPHLKVGVLVRFDPREIVRWLEERRVPEYEKRQARSWKPLS